MDRVTPFEPALPASVRALIDEARAGQGPLAAWLADNATIALLAGFPPAPVEAVGWCAGISLFHDHYHQLVPYIQRERFSAPARSMLEAFAAGLRAGVAPTKRQWIHVEPLVALAGGVPEVLRDALPIGMVSASAVDRGAAIKLAQRSNARAVVEQARDAATDQAARKRLDAALAALATDRAGDRAAPLAAGSKTELESAWLARAAHKDPRDLDALLATPWPAAWKLAYARLQALARFAPDGRIVAALPAITARYTSRAGGGVHVVAAQIRRDMADAPMPPAAHAGTSVEPLWAAVCADPTSRDARGVLADALQAAGDARGEYLALSLLEQPDAAARTRASRLLAQYIDAWTVGIPGARGDTRRFAGGLLVGVAVDASDALPASIANREWCGIEELALTGLLPAAMVPALDMLFARMPRLRTLLLATYGADLATELRAPVPQLRVLGVDRPLPDTRWGVFPRLAMCAVDASDGRIAEHLAACETLGLEALALVGESRESRDETLADQLRAFAAATLPELRLAPKRPAGELEHAAWVIRVRRGESRAQLAWGHGRYVAGSLRAHAEALLAAGYPDLAIALPASGRADAEAEARALALPKSATLDLAAPPLALWKI